jgi:hypothetical protein
VIGEDIHIDADLSASACAVRADPSQLEQVLMNLAVNARDAMPHGGVLGMRTRAVAIDETPNATGPTLPRGKYVSIVVQDTGVGISKDCVERIFEAFYTTKAEGTGLGLAMVMSIVEKLGGEVRVESTLGEGYSEAFGIDTNHTSKSAGKVVIFAGIASPEPTPEPTPVPVTATPVPPTQEPPTATPEQTRQGTLDMVLFIGLIAVLAIAAAAVYLLVLRKKKR